MKTPKFAVWRGFPFRYRDVARAPSTSLEVIRYVGGPLWDVVENSRGPDDVRVQAVFVGPAAASERAAFNELARMSGPGTFIHPELGIMTAYLAEWPESSSGVVDGIYALDLVFIPVADLPGTQIAFSAATSAEALNLIAVSALEFAATAPDTDTGASAAAVQAANSAASTALAFVADLVSADNQAAIAVAITAAGLATVSQTVEQWQAVAELLDTFEAAESGMVAVVEQWQAAIAEQETNYAIGIAHAAVYEQVGMLFAARGLTLSQEQVFETYDDAAGCAARLYAETETVMQLVSGNAAIRSLIKLRGLAYSGLLSDALQLPRRAAYETSALTSSVELAYTLYADIDRADEFDADNGIAHPGFIGAGTWRVLRD